MGPSYAGILGPIAFLTMLIRGVVRGGSVDGVLISSVASLLIFAAIGYVIGRIAEHIVLEAVRQRFNRDLKTREKSPSAGMRVQTAGGGE